MEPIEPTLIEGFIRINKFFQKHKIRYCLIGGIAAGYWGEPRFTHDMDFTVMSRTKGLQEIARLLKKNGFKIVEQGADQLQVVQHESFHFVADLIFAATDYQDWVVQRAAVVPIFQVNVPICSAEDLILLKLIANRRQDLVDIENVLKRHASHLDQIYLKEWIRTWDLGERLRSEFGRDFYDFVQVVTDHE